MYSISLPIFSDDQPTSLVRPRKAVQALSAPRDVYIVLTSRCNLRCLHCYGRYGDPGLERAELSGAEWRSIFFELADSDVFFVNIAGGEATIHPDFPEIIDALVDADLHFILTTNGMGSKRCFAAIADAKDLLLGLKISLDGPTPESHGAIRVNSDYLPNTRAFSQTMETLKYLKHRSVPFTIATCLHKTSIRLLPHFIDLIVDDICPTSWFISTIAPTGRGEDYYNEIYASDAYWPIAFWENLKERCNKAGIYVRFIDMSFSANLEGVPSAFSCPAATSFCEINSDGIVAPCPLSRVEISPDVLRFDNIRNHSLLEIWNGPPFRTFREWRGSGCEGCKAFDACGRCVAQSVKWFRDPSKPSPYCVDKGEILGLDNLDTLRHDLSTRIEQTYGLQSCKALPKS